MVRYTTTILKFDQKGEKTGWTYIEVPAGIAQKLKKNHKKSFRVKGKLDALPIHAMALLPMGGGSFIMPLNSGLRKKLHKQHGAVIYVELEEDINEFILNADLIACLKDEPAASSFFQSLPPSHQRYFSKWIDSAKTTATQTKRIAQAITFLAQKQGYVEMIRALKN